MGMGGDKVHLLHCYHACICPFLQSLSPTVPTKPLGHTVLRCLRLTLGSFLTVCESNDTHLGDDTTKHLSAYIQISASLGGKLMIKEISLPGLTTILNFSLMHYYCHFNGSLVLYLLFSEICLRDSAYLNLIPSNSGQGTS